MKLCFTVRTYFYSQAGNRVSPIYCISCRVEGKPGLITVGRIWLNYILTLCETNFVPELQPHVVCSAAEKRTSCCIMICWVLGYFGAMRSGQIPRMFVLTFEFCIGQCRSHNYGMHTFDCTTSTVAKGTGMFILLCEGLITGDPWFGTASQISSLVR